MEFCIRFFQTVTRADGMSEVIFHTEAVPRVNMMIQKLKFGRIATFDDYLKNGDKKSLGKLMDFLREQQGNEKSHTVEGDKVNSAIDGLIEKVGMFAMEKQAISVDQVKENFSINGEQAENVIKQLETIGVLGGRSEDGTHKVMMDKEAFTQPDQRVSEPCGKNEGNIRLKEHEPVRCHNQQDTYCRRKRPRSKNQSSGYLGQGCQICVAA